LVVVGKQDCLAEQGGLQTFPCSVIEAVAQPGDPSDSVIST
jgi:hypothetical protein